MPPIDTISSDDHLEVDIVQVLMTPLIWWHEADLRFNRDKKFTVRITSSFLRSVFEERRQKIIQPKVRHVKKKSGVPSCNGGGGAGQAAVLMFVYVQFAAKKTHTTFSSEAQAAETNRASGSPHRDLSKTGTITKRVYRGVPVPHWAQLTLLGSIKISGGIRNVSCHVCLILSYLILM